MLDMSVADNIAVGLGDAGSGLDAPKRRALVEAAAAAAHASDFVQRLEHGYDTLVGACGCGRGHGCGRTPCVCLWLWVRVWVRTKALCVLVWVCECVRVSGGGFPLLKRCDASGLLQACRGHVCPAASVNGWPSPAPLLQRPACWCWTRCVA